MTTYFGVRVGKSGDSENFADLARSNGYVAIVWHQLGVVDERRAR